MDKIKLSGKLYNASMRKVEGIQLYKGGNDDTATISLTPLELVEQITLQDMCEILKFINLPKPETCTCEKPRRGLVAESPTERIYTSNCQICFKPIKPQEQFEIEPIVSSHWDCGTKEAVLADKVNEIIKVLNTFKTEEKG